MTVKELRAKLRGIKEESEVYISQYDYDGNEHHVGFEVEINSDDPQFDSLRKSFQFIVLRPEEQ